MADDQNGTGGKKPMAILIDGDNAQAAFLKEILAEASKYGRITVRRLYGDWTTPSMNGWKECLQENAIQPIQQFRYTVGKNATDSAMIIDTMDILHSCDIASYCLVTSDSDYILNESSGMRPARCWSCRNKRRKNGPSSRTSFSGSKEH